MKNIAYILGIALLASMMASCGTDKTIQLLQGPAGANGADGKDGANGKDGKDGANGHSLASQFMSATELECANGGSRLDIYLDLDDSLSASEDDSYLGSLVACNGANGLDGEQGEPGIQGPPGLIGPPGLNGNPGHDGSQGPTGPQGPQGPAGTPGAQGPRDHGARAPPPAKSSSSVTRR